jgi:hypothetical protein
MCLFETRPGLVISLIHKPLQPERPCQHRSSQGALIILEQNHVSLILRRYIEFKHPFKTVLGLALFASVLQRVPYEPISDKNEGRVAGATCDEREPFRSGLRRTTLACCEVYGPLRKESPQLGVHVVQALGEFKRLGHDHPCPFGRPHRENQCNPKCHMQPQSKRRTQVQIKLKTVQRTLSALTALDH